MPQHVYIPPAFDPSRRWPVILFLHGAGERGTDGVRPMEVGIGSAIRAHPERIPAIVVFPQCPRGECWVGEPADAAMRALDDAIDEFNGDPARVYLTGLSMGGYGAYHLALAHPDRFAAMIVVCGGIVPPANAQSFRSPFTMNAADPYALAAHALRAMPMRLFHGADDPIIPVTESRRMAEVLSNVEYTEYAGVGHDSWDRAYAEPDLWPWLFRQRRGDSGTLD